MMPNELPVDEHLDKFDNDQDEPSCEFCKFMGLDEDRSGNKYPVYRRYAPRKHHGSGTGYDGEKFPAITHDLDWCGEFELQILKENNE